MLSPTKCHAPLPPVRPTPNSTLANLKWPLIISFSLRWEAPKRALIPLTRTPLLSPPSAPCKFPFFFAQRCPEKKGCASTCACLFWYARVSINFQLIENFIYCQQKVKNESERKVKSFVATFSTESVQGRGREGTNIDTRTAKKLEIKLSENC